MYYIIKAMKAFLNYEYMITPGILKILSYIGSIIAIIAGVIAAFSADIWTGLATAIGGPIVIRIYAEIMLVIFELHKEVKKISAR